MDSYKFYTEIEEEFEFLMPERKIGLVIFHLFQKKKNDDISSTFTENEIIESIKKVRQDIKTDQKEQFNHTIKFLQKYYLWRDEDKRVYRFRPMAIKICEMFDDVLFRTFTPTQIEKDFKYIQNKLEQDENNFGQWYNYTFTGYKDKVNSQISALDRQMENAVDAFRSKIINEYSYNIIALKEITDKLNEIGQKADELNMAFSGSHQITRLLTKILSISDNSPYSEEINLVISFFKDIRENLKIISKRIDRIKPKLNEYIRDINRQDFFKKYKSFMKVLLAQSTSQNNQLCLPIWLPKCEIQPQNSSKFVIIKDNWDKENIYRPKTSKLIISIPNKEETQKRLIEVNNSLELQMRIKSYLSELDKKCETAFEVDFSEYFFSVLEKENGNVDISAQLAYYAMNKYHRDKEFEVSITEERVCQHKYPTISIWKTIIYKKI